MNTYAAVHEHEYGVSVYLFQSPRDWDSLPLWYSGTDMDEECDRLCQLLDIRFEPDKEEVLAIVEVDPTKMPIVP